MADPQQDDDVTSRDQTRIVVARRALLTLLEEDRHLLPGGVVERLMRCGKQNCRCAADPTQLHGPYHQWGYSKEGRRYTRRLTDEQLERYAPEIERGRLLMELLVALNEAEITRVERAEGWGP